MAPSEPGEDPAKSVGSYGTGEAGYAAWKFVGKFVDHVCMEGSLSDTQRQALHNNLAEVVSMQIQMMDTVYHESKRVPARSKPKLDSLRPELLLSGEMLVEPTPLRCHLVPDGRDEVCGSAGGTVLLPAEGALFLTNYRIIFRGVPVNDSLMSDAVITRSLPVASLMKEKRIGSQYRTSAASSELAALHDGLQMRSATFQLIKVFFDEEVGADKVERFRQTMLKIRYPQSVLEFFCFAGLKPTGPFQSSTLHNGASAPKDFPGGGGGNAEFYAPTLNIKTKEKHTDALRLFHFHFPVWLISIFQRTRELSPRKVQISKFVHAD